MLQDSHFYKGQATVLAGLLIGKTMTGVGKHHPIQIIPNVVLTPLIVSFTQYQAMIKQLCLYFIHQILKKMATKIFVNLPVNDLNKSIAFFTKLGFSFNPQFTDHEATCMIISDNIFAMLLVKQRFKDFTKKEICDAAKNTEVLLALDAESREKVDEMVRNAVEAGGTTYMQSQDHGWMYGHSFADLDGHQWEVLYMDPGGIGNQ